MKRFATLFSILIIIAHLSVSAQDWPRWRGPAANGISGESAWKPASIKAENIIWKASLGKAYSSFSIQDGRAYTMGSTGSDDSNEDIVYCLDAASGREIWRHTYANKLGGWPGPRITPTLDKGRVYTISRTGKTFCLDAKTGRIIWQRDLEAEEKAVDPDCGISGSPLIFRDLVIYNAGEHGVALNKNTGEVAWHSGTAKGGFASPVLYEKGGKAHVAMLGRTTLYDIDPATGQVNWSMPWVTRYEENTIDPVIIGDRLFISTGYGKGAALLNISGAQPEIIWQNKLISNHFHNSILVDGHIYGIHGDYGRKGSTLRCLNLESGALVWEAPMEFGPVTVAGDKIIHMGEKGLLTVARLSPKSFEKIHTIQILQQPDDTGVRRSRVNRCWAPPVLANRQLYVRNSYGETACIALD